MPEGRSLHSRYPDHRVELEPGTERVRVRFHGQLVADSRRTLIVRETKHDPVVYFPKADLDARFLEPSGHATFCPFKGEASYWSLRVGEHRAEDAIWGYDDPFEEVASLAGYRAFYPDRVDWERGG
jgi:uncharacterized protein (DUF427 family)